MLRPRIMPWLLTLCLTAATLDAHGGQYRGPTNGSPNAVPTPRRPARPGRSVPGGPTTGGNATLDINSWRVWWELNHDRYVHGGGSQVDDATRRATILPTLTRALDKTDDPDLNSAGLIALGKVAVDHPTIDVLDVLRKRIRRAHIEVREAAILGMGLSGRSDAVDDLDALLRNTARGRQLVQRKAVSDRGRTFAAYALGLLAQRSSSAAIQGKVLASLTTVLASKPTEDRDVLTGVLNAIRILDVDPNRGGAHKRLQWQAIAALEEFHARRFKSQMANVQSHVLTALAAIVGRGDDVMHERTRKLLVDVLSRRRSQDGTIWVAAVIALGETLRPTDTKELDGLLRRIKRPPDSLVPKFGMIALGKIGGAAAFKQLSQSFRRGKRDVKPWAALGLGLLAFHRDPNARPANPQRKPIDFRAEVGKVLHKGLLEERNKDLRAAIAIGLGLADCKAAAADLRKLATKYTTSEEFAGPLCVSLAMLGDQKSIPIARDAMGNIWFPVLLGRAGLALARLGQRDASGTALGYLQRADITQHGWLTRLAGVTQALGYLKNPNDVATLASLIGRAKKRDIRAAFAAAALGAIADKDRIGFGARIARGMNYTARAQTISNGKSGILDIF